MLRHSFVSCAQLGLLGVTIALTSLTQKTWSAAALQLRIYTSGAPADVQKVLAPKFTGIAGQQLTFTVGPLAAVQQKLTAGEKADVNVGVSHADHRAPGQSGIAADRQPD